MPDDGQDDVADNIDVGIRDFKDKIAKWMFTDYTFTYVCKQHGARPECNKFIWCL